MAAGREQDPRQLQETFEKRQVKVKPEMKKETRVDQKIAYLIILDNAFKQ